MFSLLSFLQNDAGIDQTALAACAPKCNGSGSSAAGTAPAAVTALVATIAAVVLAM
jgi:hypothetical protein